MMEEQYDILNEQGEPTGEVLPKSEVHDRELWHASSCIWIYNDAGEVLLQKRGPDKKTFPNTWDVSVAGHIAAGETPEAAAVREVKEEIGVDINPDELELVLHTSDIVPFFPNKHHPEYCWVYILHKNLDLKHLLMQESEVTDLKLIAIDEVRSARSQTDKANEYSARKAELYDIPLAEIEKRLNA
jgi:isopentenyldiphosphate isomerase